MTQWARIVRKTEIMGGRACIRGTRVTVSTILGQMGAGHTIEEFLRDYPYICREDVLEALRYAAEIARKETL